MREVFIYRHGQTEYNALGKIQGQGIDSSLNGLGRLQAQAFFDYYKSVPFDIGYYSGLKRSRETIQPFIDHGLEAQQRDTINEISWGVWEGQSYNPEIKRIYKEMIEAWGNGNPDYKLPEGESANELTDRLHLFWDEILSQNFTRAYNLLTWQGYQRIAYRNFSRVAGRDGKIWT